MFIVLTGMVTETTDNKTLVCNYIYTFTYFSSLDRLTGSEALAFVFRSKVT